MSPPNTRPPLSDLADVEVPGAERDDVIDERLDALGHEGLQHVAFDRQPKAGHGGEPRAVAGDGERDLVGADDAARGLDARRRGRSRRGCR